VVEEIIVFDDQLTILIPTSPIPSHPSTAIIDEVIAGLRHYFPSARIIIMCDGVRASVEHRRFQYTEYLSKLMSLYLDDPTIHLKFFTDPTQQAWMTRETLKEVTTPFVLFNEHDAILRAEPAIEWSAIFHLLETDQANLVRFYHWDRIWHEHEYLMRERFTFENVEFVRTVQFSGWPFAAKTSYLTKLVTDHFHPQDRKMIETGLYGPICAQPWEANKVVIYYPEKANTFNHRNARVSDAGIKDPGEW
jgi:hypothetical protein